MAHDVNLQQEIFNKTLQEVAQDVDHGEDANPCVICLEQISDVGIALPCKHASFDFICLASWLGERPVCPLCQAQVTGVKHDVHSPQGPKIYSLPPPSESSHSTPSFPTPAQRRRRPWPRPHPRREHAEDDPLARRRHVYRHELYSQRVGTNRLSQYREITPQLFNQDETLVSRARKWIRRELQVFEFLNPDNPTDGDPDLDRGATRRRANNAEFLLEYIIAILRTVDIKGSGGQAEELLREFIGRRNARLFLHELQAWLRSPYNSLEDWDRAVQYDERMERFPTPESSERSDVRSPSRVNLPRGGRDTYRPGPRRKSRLDRRFDESRMRRRIQHAMKRYHPD
ncbi:hypothetical protein VTO42DRAFT_4366 [Malbranchea cinnamomea]